MNIKIFTYKFARIVSTLFIPPTLMFSSFIFLAFYLDITAAESWYIILISAVFSFILPILYFTYLIKNGKVVNQDATIKEERTKPYIFGIILFIVGLILLAFVTNNPVIITFWCCYIINSVIITLINKYWKISAHALGVASPLALLVIFEPNFAYFYFAFVLVIGWSRLHLKCHTLAQVIAGTLAGFLLTYFQLEFILHILEYGS